MKGPLSLSPKFMYRALLICIIFLVGVVGVFGYEMYQVKQAEKHVVGVNKLLDLNDTSREGCQQIFDVDQARIFKTETFVRQQEFENVKHECNLEYHIFYTEKTQEFCEKMIQGQKEDFREDFMVLDGFSEAQTECSLKFLSVTFSTGSLFDVENDFKSSINIDFGLPFYEDIDDTNSEKFLTHRIKAKKRFLNLLEISPNIEIGVDDIVLHPKSGTLVLNLEPETRYSFSLKSYDSNIEGEEVETEKLVFTTPTNIYFGIKVQEKVSLFQDNAQPNFELISHGSKKTGGKIQICRISNDDYARIEVFREQEGLSTEKKDFFTAGIDDLEQYECYEKDIAFDDGEKIFQKKAFNFSDLIGAPARSGLYYVTFANPGDRQFDSQVQNPLFFGIIDSHITMKLSKNGNAFFFVNDLDGKPLAGQKIRAYVNDFVSQDKKWDRKRKEYDITYTNPLEKGIFSKEVILGETNSEGILEVDMKEKVDDAFNKTFYSYNYERDGNHKSFFVTSASDTNLSYVSSKWNGGIQGWNFGYTLGGGWWYGESQNMDAIELETWRGPEPSIYSHTYTDRRLYLPGEQVHIKSLVRDSKDLSIPKDKTFTLKVLDPKGKTFSESEIGANEYGSVMETLSLGEEALLGSYQIYLSDVDNIIGRSGFSVEIFKNPKFKNEVMLQTMGLVDEVIQDVEVDTKKTRWGYERKEYSSKFDIQASVTSLYYSGGPVKNSEMTYKVYKQYYYDMSYWDDCYYGCYGEPEKEFYTEGKSKLDENGNANLTIPISFESRYQDYKYIVEVSVTDDAGDTISGSNSIIAKLPNQYKRWNPESGVYFETEKRFYKSGEMFEIQGGLTQGNFTTEYDEEFIFIIKKKEYATNMVRDVRGYDRPVTRSSEKIEKILRVNTENFILRDGKISLKYALPETGEYVFEFGKINKELPFDIDELIQDFQKEQNQSLEKLYQGDIEVSRDTWDMLNTYCNFEDSDSCSKKSLLELLGCTGANRIDSSCEGKTKNIEIPLEFNNRDLIDKNTLKYFTLVGYGGENASNPIESDNKIQVLSEKVSYKLGEKARVLVRLPFSKGKILWTIEKQGVLKHEYIDVPGNTFFKEIEIDGSFIPNAYIGVTVVDTNREKTPEYKVGYTEIVVDKTDKKSEITIVANKKIYEPREEVVLNLGVKDPNGKEKPSELTVMVVDDSLISLMGNIDANTLEKFYKKLPFQIQTSITNIAMLRNYYFSRQGFVGGSGFGNFKGGDSAVSSRNIFKNTAYYNPSVITDENGKAQVSFTLPDNLTNFRVMVLSNSKDNFFGYSENFIEVRKDVIVEERTPLIIRENDEIVLGANIFNTTDKKIGFKAILSADGLTVDTPEKVTMIPAGESEFVTWNIKNSKTCGYLEEKCESPYMISILGDSAKHSDKIEGTIEIASVPSLIENSIVSKILSVGELGDMTLTLPENTNIEKSSYHISFSNSPLLGIEKIVKSLAVYPFGCGEQLLSSTLPNAVLKQFTNILADTGVKQSTIDTNLSAGLEKIYDMALENGAFKYWYNDTEGNIHITAYGVRVLLEIQRSGTEVNTEILEKAVAYLIKNYEKAEGMEKAESLWAIANYHGTKTESLLGVTDLAQSYETTDMKRHELLALTYGLILSDKEKYKQNIDENIAQISELLDARKSGGYYYSVNSDMGELVQMLIEYGGDKKLIVKYINELYKNDWESYWQSTKAKSNAFLAFVKYIEVYGRDSINTLDFTLNEKSTQIQIGEKTNSYANTLGLGDVLKDDKVALTIKNVSGEELYATTRIESYPKDPLKIKSFSDGVTLKRNVYEVVNENDMRETCKWNDGDRTCTEASGLKLHSGDTFKKGVTYKVILEATFEARQRRENLTMEDYLPAGFTILNSNFKTNSIATSQDTTDENSWNWSHVEKRPSVVMAHSKNTWGRTARYEYFVRADFEGDFIYPPAVVYLMYQPDTRANTEFRRVIIK